MTLNPAELKNFRACFGGLMATLKPIRWKVLLGGTFGTVLVATSLGFVWTSKNVVDVATGKTGELGKAIVLMASVMMVQVVFRILQRYWEGYIVVSTQNDLRKQIYEKVLHSEWIGKERFHSGDAVNRLEEDIRVCVDFLCTSLPQCLVTCLQLVASSVYLFSLSPKLGWILIFIMPVAVVGSRLFFFRLRALTNEIRQLESKIQGHMQENLQHRVVIRTLGCTRYVMEKLGLLQNDVRGKTIVRLNYNAVARIFLQLGFASGYGLAFFWSAYGLKDGTVTYGLMVAFLQLVGQIQRPVADLTSHIPYFIRALSSQERLMELEEQKQEAENGDIFLGGLSGIRVEHLCYSYPDYSETVLNDFSHDFKPGTMTAIVGHTGAGKSTLIRVMLSLLSPQSGKVTVYNAERQIQASPDTRCNFMYVPQGNTLMSGTIRDNLLLADKTADDERIREALHIAVADFVFDLPDGLDTVCAETGNGLSEGQAQRIAIARALLRPGSILILDEATSALDAVTEQTLLERMSGRYRGNKTIIFITHRLFATDFADEVVNLDGNN